MRAVVDNFALERWRSIDSRDVLLAVADYAKRDPDFVPVKDPRTERWHAVIAGREFDFLLTGSKFWDTGSSWGGGGAVDLFRHVFDCGFVEAARKLKQLKL